MSYEVWFGQNGKWFGYHSFKYKMDAQRKLEVEELRQFLKDNPHYRYPGMALPNGRIKPLDVCWGSDKTYYIGSDKVKRSKC